MNPEMLHQLGQSRTSRQRDHLLQAPDSFVRAPLPGMLNAAAVVHIAPAAGAGFTEYTVEFEANGRLGRTSQERFLFVLDGELQAQNLKLKTGGYAFFPQGASPEVQASGKARAIVIEKDYVPLEGCSPAAFSGILESLTPEPLLDDPQVLVRTMVPSDPAYDLAVNVIEFFPGASLPMLESHVMEHGLMMLSGSGIYRLNDSWYPVTAGDFIWMARYCPQWFAAVGKQPARYLIYKDWNRHPL